MYEDRFGDEKLKETIKKYGQSEKGSYIRVGNAKKPMTTSMITEMFPKN